ncbi:hypothetical protein SDC9_156482 [bioreactor metagenome]|uniref:Uncharacterized protein n=1 Tax=bioreactor metagenome TaxID=1076179 RepID=A0A645F9Q0_9ZZZZ
MLRIGRKQHGERNAVEIFGYHAGELLATAIEREGIANIACAEDQTVDAAIPFIQQAGEQQLPPKPKVRLGLTQRENQRRLPAIQQPENDNVAKRPDDLLRHQRPEAVARICHVDADCAGDERGKQRRDAKQTKLQLALNDCALNRVERTKEQRDRHHTQRGHEQRVLIDFRKRRRKKI